MQQRVVCCRWCVGRSKWVESGANLNFLLIVHERQSSVMITLPLSHLILNISLSYDGVREEKYFGNHFNFSSLHWEKKRERERETIERENKIKIVVIAMREKEKEREIEIKRKIFRSLFVVVQVKRRDIGHIHNVWNGVTENFPIVLLSVLSTHHFHN